MPWEHCGAPLGDDVSCPACGLTKAQWTVTFEVTRTFRVARSSAIRVSLVDAEGEPVPDEPLELRLADGQVVTARLDADGQARLAGPEGAAATVVLLRWAAGDVAREQDPDRPRADEPTADEPPGPARFEVQGGRSLRLRLAAPTLLEARWSTLRARFDGLVELRVRTRGLPRGARIELQVLEHDADGAHDPVMKLAAPVKLGRAVIGWHVPVVDDEDDVPTEVDREAGFALPELFFVARHGALEARCGDLLQFATDLELPLRDPAGTSLGAVDYQLSCNGRVRRGRTGDDGVLREAGVGPDFEVRLADGRRVAIRAHEEAS